mgnify:CR=1 FL=1
MSSLCQPFTAASSSSVRRRVALSVAVLLCSLGVLLRSSAANSASSSSDSSSGPPQSVVRDDANVVVDVVRGMEGRPRLATSPIVVSSTPSPRKEFLDDRSGGTALEAPRAVDRNPPRGATPKVTPNDDGGGDKSTALLRGKQTNLKPLTRRPSERPAVIHKKLGRLVRKIGTSDMPSLLIIGSGDAADIFSAICHSWANATKSALVPERCPRYGDHIHDERILSRDGNATLVQFLYWARGQPPPVGPAIAQPAVVLIGRGVLDMLIYDVHPRAAAVEIRAVVAGLRAAHPGASLHFLMPRYVVERPMHVFCLAELRQFEQRHAFGDELIGAADASRFAPDNIVDPWPMTRELPHTRYDWRGVGLLRWEDAAQVAVYALRRLQHDRAAEPFDSLVEAGRFASGGNVTAQQRWSGERRCHCMTYHPSWCSADEARRKVPTGLWQRSLGWAPSASSSTTISTMASSPPHDPNATTQPDNAVADVGTRTAFVNVVLEGDLIGSGKRHLGALRTAGPSPEGPNVSVFWKPAPECETAEQPPILGHLANVTTLPVNGNPLVPGPARIEGAVNATRDAAKMGAEASNNCTLRDLGSPCGPVPTSFDHDHEWIIRQIETRWPLKPQYLEVPCDDYVAMPARLADQEPMGAPRCLIYFGRRALDLVADADNYPDVDLEECLASRRIRALIIGSSHQLFGLPIFSTLIPKQFRNTEGLNMVDEGYVGFSWDREGTEAVSVKFLGKSVVEQRWDPLSQTATRPLVLRDRPMAAKGFTHIVFGTGVHGHTLDDWRPWEQSDAGRRFIDFFADPRSDASPASLQIIMQHNTYMWPRPMGSGPDVCQVDYRVRLFREALNCGVWDRLRELKWLATNEDDGSPHHRRRVVTVGRNDSSQQHASEADGSLNVVAPLSTVRRRRGEDSKPAPPPSSPLPHQRQPFAGFRVFDPYPMTSRDYSKSCLQWDGGHFDDFTVPFFIFYSNHAPLCRDHIVATVSSVNVLSSPSPAAATSVTQKATLREGDDEEEGSSAVARSPPPPTCGPLNCRHPPIAVTKHPRSSGMALSTWLDSDPRHLGRPATKLCGCRRHGCSAAEQDTVDQWQKLAAERRARLGIKKLLK